MGDRGRTEPGRRFGPTCRAVFERIALPGVQYRPLDPPIMNDIYAVSRYDARADVTEFIRLLRQTVDADPDLLPIGCSPLCADPL